MRSLAALSLSCALAAMASPPATLRECETDGQETCGTWTAAGDHFDARWDDGTTAVVRVVRFDADTVVLAREDTGATAGLTATYTGHVTDLGFEAGTVTWTRSGRSWSGTWSAERE
jgi:hypothetical protein